MHDSAAWPYLKDSIRSHTDPDLLSDLPTMGSPIDLFVTLSKDAAYIAADLAPVPGVTIAVDLLFGIVQLCQNVTTNK